jgi:autotransporter translocation and assembly factor TamB
MTVTPYDRDPRGGSAWRRLAVVLRGLLAVALLLAGAVDELVTSAIGAPPVLPRAARAARKAGREVGEAFRGGRDGVLDAEVIEDARRWR